ncbi:hypothetical protein ACLOJK_021744 [Asimina triloba]
MASSVPDLLKLISGGLPSDFLKCIPVIGQALTCVDSIAACFCKQLFCVPGLQVTAPRPFAHFDVVTVEDIQLGTHSVQ